MRVGILGGLEIEGGSGPVLLGAAKERAVVAALALQPGRVVDRGVLIEALWGDRPPASAVKTLQNYVARVRRALGADACSIVTEPGGYRLVVEADDVDA